MRGHASGSRAPPPRPDGICSACSTRPATATCCTFCIACATPTSATAWRRASLPNVLSDALPPIDERVLSDAAGRFDDLESIREQVERADRTAAAAQPVPRRIPGLCPHRAQPPGRRRRRGRDPTGRRRARRTAPSAVATAAEAVERRTAELDALKRERLAVTTIGGRWSRARRTAPTDLADRDARVTPSISGASAETTSRTAATAHEQAIAEAATRRAGDRR